MNYYKYLIYRSYKQLSKILLLSKDYSISLQLKLTD